MQPTLSNDDLLAFRRDGHVRLRAVYSADDIAELDRALLEARRVAERLAGDADEQLERDSFLSRRSHALTAFVCERRLGAFAAELLGTDGVRLIHDVALTKSRAHGPTPWHRDSDFWSFTGAGAITLWIPLQDTPMSMSSMRYASGSHLAHDRRPLGRLERALISARYRVTCSALEVGDVAVHHYATLHGAARNRESRSRRAYAVHLIDADARFRESTGDRHLEHSRRCGWDKLSDGQPFSDIIAPLVYRRPT